MKKEEINSKKSNQAILPYSPAVKFGSLLFVSGQIGIDPKTNEMAASDIKIQTEQVFYNLKKVLEAGGAGLENVLKVNVYLTDMNNFPVMNEIYAKKFKKPYPARVTVEVSKLPRGAMIEIDCIAFTKGDSCCGCCRGNCD